MRKGHLSWRTAPAVTVLAVAALSMLASAGCSKSPEERITEAAIGAITGKDVAVDKDGEKVTFGTGDDAVTISGGDAAELPATFPKDIWLPADYKVESVMDSTGFTMVSLRADGSIKDATTAAQKTMEGAGWKRTMSAQDDTNSMLAFQHGDRSALLSFDRHDESGVVYTVQLSNRQSQQ